MDCMFYYNNTLITEINQWNVANTKSMEAIFKFSLRIFFTNVDGMFAQTKQFGQDIDFDRVLKTAPISIAIFLDKNELGSYCCRKITPDQKIPRNDSRSSAPFKEGKLFFCITLVIGLLTFLSMKEWNFGDWMTYLSIYEIVVFM